jgi:putative restriction endonuclease
MMSEDLDHLVRLAAFQWLRGQVELQGEVLPRPLLAEGFRYGETRVPLLGPQGIFKPAILTGAPLSITTAPRGPYADSFAGGLLRYAYRGTNPEHPDNRGLRLAMARQLPLVYLFGIEPGRYMPVWPVYVVGDSRGELFFDVAVDDPQVASVQAPVADAIAEDRTEIRREYITATVRRRLHQQAFRARVIEAYRVQCALCRLRHHELLDAAHITGDALPEGEPVVSNGLSLCKLHHAAYDRHFLTVRPDYVIEVRQSLLDEEDGPMLLNGLKGMHLEPIVLPRSPALQPDRDRLAARYQAFRALP